MFWLYIILGILPSLVWLSIYLKEDDHPEPNLLILQTFFLGALAAPLAAGVEFVLVSVLEGSFLPILISNILIFFIAIALVEEYWKYLVVKLTAAKTKAFDEPADAMIYLIVAALGFAAVENIIALFSFVESTSDVIEIVLLRFLSATLLHVLASAIVGYFLAREHFFFKKKQALKGIIIAAFLHGVYNILTLASNGFEKLSVTIYIILLLGIMAIIVNILFYKLKKDWHG